MSSGFFIQLATYAALAAAGLSWVASTALYYRRQLRHLRTEAGHALRDHADNLDRRADALTPLDLHQIAQGLRVDAQNLDPRPTARPYPKGKP